MFGAGQFVRLLNEGGGARRATVSLVSGAPELSEMGFLKTQATGPRIRP